MNESALPRSKTNLVDHSTLTKMAENQLHNYFLGFNFFYSVNNILSLLSPNQVITLDIHIFKTSEKTVQLNRSAD